MLEALPEPDVVLLPDFEPVAEPLCDPELFAVPVSFAVPELLDSSSLLSLLSSVAVALVLALVREPLSLSPVWLVALSFTSDDCSDEAALEESSWRAMSRGATSRLKASTGWLNMDGHADAVAERSRTVERTDEGRMAASYVCACTVD